MWTCTRVYGETRIGNIKSKGHFGNEDIGLIWHNILEAAFDFWVSLDNLPHELLPSRRAFWSKPQNVARKLF